ncbi:uncharacterized protein LOC112494000 isoform X1 [Cephus cinctus]|uniref:Uncharacterized protein LOC112494000 isoform X1 n=1 Tax=Cephus cinctus TaxID=211228 RepID=A0AAJ7RCJ0_CEPCN|nr:uncharacterized protein LOC112494000 isoform X1 [Cephus cinctus]
MFMYRRKRRLRTVCCVHSAFQRQHVGVFCDTAPLVYSQSFELQHSIANGFFSSFTEGLKVTRKGREWKKNRINSAKPLRDNMLHRLVWVKEMENISTITKIQCRHAPVDITGNLLFLRGRMFALVVLLNAQCIQSRRNVVCGEDFVTR